MNVYRSFIEGFSDKRLQDGLQTYYELWEKGLKKQANQGLRETMLYFDSLDQAVQDSFAYFYCSAISDKEEFGNLFSRMFYYADIPYEISIRIRSIIERDFDRGLMPQMKWYYQFFNHDIEVIEKAYAHPDCDEQTVAWYFSALLGILDWGAHHLPEGCLIEKKESDGVIGKCRDLVAKHKIQKELLSDYHYYALLYEAWWEYEKTQKEMVFAKWCEQKGIRFDAVEAYYYS